MSDLQHDGRDEYEDFDDGPIYDEGRRRLSPLARTLVVTAIAVAGLALAGLVWFAYNEGVRSGAEETAPVLRADTAPVKRKPDDPGGMDIPNQDKLVYQRIAPGQTQQPVERLLPPPEAPVARPVPEPPAETPSEAESKAMDSAEPSAGGTSIAQAIRQATNETIAATEAGDGKTPFVREPDDAAKADATTPEKAPEPAMDKPAMEKAEAAPPPPPAPEPVQQAAVPPPAPEPAPATPAGSAWRIQLASLTSEATARQEWDRLQKANSDLLGELALNVQQANLSTGTYYRIQAGPLADRAAASALCGKLKTRKQDCLVVAP